MLGTSQGCCLCESERRDSRSFSSRSRGGAQQILKQIVVLCVHQVHLAILYNTEMFIVGACGKVLVCIYDCMLLPALSCHAAPNSFCFSSHLVLLYHFMHDFSPHASLVLLRDGHQQTLLQPARWSQSVCVLAWACNCHVMLLLS